MKKLLYFILFFSGIASAQNTINPTYTYTLPGKWESWAMAPGGVLLVGNGTGLTAIEAHSQKIIYNYSDLGKIKPEEMDLIDGLPWVVLHQGGKTAPRSKKVVLDYFTGKPVFESGRFGWVSPTGYELDTEGGKIILWGLHEKSINYVGIYDINQNKELATFDLKDKNLTGGGMVIMTNLKITDNRLIVPTTKGTVCINLKTNKQEWSTTAISSASGILNYLFDEANNCTYAFNPYLKAKVFKIDNATGTAAWSKPISLDGAVKEVRIIREGLWVYSEEEKSFDVNIYDPKTAQPLWKKSFTEKGGIRASIFTDDGVVFGTSNGEVNTLLHNGTARLSKNIQTGAGYQAFTLTQSGDLFYLTSLYMGIVNLKDGGFVKEPSKFKKVEKNVTAFDEKNNRFLVSTGNELFFIERDGTSRKVTDIAFKGNEFPDKMDFRNDGILLTSPQNAMMVKYDGTKVFDVYFKAPGTSLAGKMLAGAVMVASTGMAVGNSAQAGMMAGSSPNYKSDAQRRAESNAQSSGQVAGSAYAAMSQRFSATTATKNSLYIQTSLDQGVGLLKINKDSGKTEGQIVLNDKKPEYLVDEDFGVFYYKKADNTIVGYDIR
jgi:hypothetical protein